MSELVLLRARPAVVEARQVTTGNRDEVIAWMAEHGANVWPYGVTGITWSDREVGGIADAFVDDWIVKTATGDFKRVLDSKLAALYERVLTAVSE